MRLLLHLLLCLAALPAIAAPTTIHAHYDLYYGSIRGAVIDETYTQTGDHYTLESVSQATGIVKLFKPEVIRITSSGRITSHGLRPDAFVTMRKLDSERNVSADFDWVHQQITLNDHNARRTTDLPADCQDRLSAMYQFMFLKLQDVGRIDFHMTNGSKVDIYNYTLTHGQSITTPLGTFPAIYATSPKEPGASRTEVWLATDRYNLAAKMVITDPDGKSFTQVLTGLDFLP